ncbi:autotransporter outer membrane beta-barrel domain-containing protein [Pelagibacterium sp. H642]|uniref:autotransporter family protein n=1 Tax=Pelagibacterium sp. H642 TaxID=1881069 RepID=UPI002815D64D|nr:autotransporter outer membrane beta-barrel domain-containing protein [Pelagibacterium sp. H642]WMT92883.1 autotransporter outer membrane beta-barrel domain-containing protein [Pelagibacterium sp. H642]
MQVENAGLIDLTNAGTSTRDRFVIAGNYLGLSGNLNLQTYLGDDTSPSDQLVLRGNGARAAGNTVINITNIDGPGAMTTGNGIRVVDAEFGTGARTDESAFRLGGPVGAGVFEYLLYYGGVGADANDNDWYLRSSVPEPPSTEPPTTLPAPVPPLPSPPDPEPPLPEVPNPPDPTPLPEPIPTDPGEEPTPPEPTEPPPPTPPLPPAPLPPEPLPPAPPAPTPEQPPLVETPLIRPEIPGYVVAPAIAQRMGIAALDRFHAREGDQSLLNELGTASAGWGRLFGRSVDQSWAAEIGGLDFDLDPRFDGEIWGLQAGLDILAEEDTLGAQNRVGIFFTHTAAHGHTSGTTLAQIDRESGSLTLNSESLGGYWTYVDPEGWYLDAVAMVSWLHGEAVSDRGIGADIWGHALLASLEAGYPFALNENWTIEPQAQLIWQNVHLDDTEDQFSSIEYGALNGLTGRLGFRLEGDLEAGDVPVQPFADVNFWHNFGSSYTATFNDRPVTTNVGGTSLELGAGLAAEISPDVSLYGAVNYTMGLSGQGNGGFGGHVGLRVSW